MSDTQFAIRHHGVGNEVEVWQVAVGASAGDVGADTVLSDDPRTAAGDRRLLLAADGTYVAENDIEAARGAKRAELSALRKAAINSTFPHLGKRIACHAEARQDFTEQDTAVRDGLPGALPIEWRCADDTYLNIPDAAAWSAVKGAYAAHKMACWAVFRQHEALLAASPDPASYAIQTGWPSTV